jgi:predicted flavoprotein YhiN
MKKTETFDVVIVGGGASGLMSASVASSLGKKVLIIEKNKTLGNKLSITGGGRCNITNAEEDIHKFLSSYESSADFLYSPFSKFGNKDTFKYFESKGLPIVVEARKRAFPHTQKATDVVNFFKRKLQKARSISDSVPKSRKLLKTRIIRGFYLLKLKMPAIVPNLLSLRQGDFRIPRQARLEMDSNGFLI